MALHPFDNGLWPSPPTKRKKLVSLNFPNFYENVVNKQVLASEGLCPSDPLTIRGLRDSPIFWTSLRLWLTVMPTVVLQQQRQQSVLRQALKPLIKSPVGHVNNIMHWKMPALPQDTKACLTKPTFL